MLSNVQGFHNKHLSFLTQKAFLLQVFYRIIFLHLLPGIDDLP